MTGFDTADGPATLALLQGSCKFHAAFAERFGGLAMHRLVSHKDELKFINEEYGCALKVVRCPAGSMALFDSHMFDSRKASPSVCSEARA